MTNLNKDSNKKSVDTVVIKIQCATITVVMNENPPYLFVHNLALK